MDSAEEDAEEDSEDGDSLDKDEEENWQEEMKSKSKVEQFEEILNRLREFKR